ncbi:hypothetical protein F5Y00DRAFT_226897 [Daldinia vernicosa]|uniref:uncharacterized protein n=1 Tax=Daldinia vernicosa TaxID=114800 RepID=UPI00200814E2|nr:uncharacterized protein F5Y00DRAFT_226897 [Daldinia vernicosa]KAI0852520.1 hypothetical protein F5Y00DRAFT_226897 [Daldinia vernicosa]
MSSQSQADLSRIRDNQRRSRARRKEYVKSLEERLGLYKRQGAEVTSHIQRAAQRVAEHNQKMRILLNTLGFTDERIDCFLQNGNINPGEAITSNFSLSSRPIYGDIEANITGSSTYDQAKSEALAANLQIHDVTILGQDTTGIASTGYLSSSQTPPGQAQDELSQYTHTLNQLLNKPLIHGSQYNTSSSHQDVTIYEQSFEAGHMTDRYSNLPHTSRKSIGSPIADALLPATLQHSQTHLDYVSPIHYDSNNSDGPSCLPLTPNISSSLHGKSLSF